MRIVVLLGEVADGRDDIGIRVVRVGWTGGQERGVTEYMLVHILVFDWIHAHGRVRYVNRLRVWKDGRKCRGGFLWGKLID